MRRFSFVLGIGGNALKTLTMLVAPVFSMLGAGPPPHTACGQDKNKLGGCLDHVGQVANGPRTRRLICNRCDSSPHGKGLRGCAEDLSQGTGKFGFSSLPDGWKMPYSDGNGTWKPGYEQQPFYAAKPGVVAGFVNNGCASCC